MDLMEQTKVIDRLSYSRGRINGVIDMIETRVSKQKLIEVLRIVSYNLEQAISTLLKDDQKG